ncbi:MAG TPA: transglycosylase domain-containing protein [Candidatus Dormibacteraeota bacterium]|nr:transglycosylase domain-containing protein [Candidatus Dormibacteraeota bacterium]
MRTWMESQVERVRPWTAVLLARLRALLAVALPWLREKSASTGTVLRDASAVTGTALREASVVTGSALKDASAATGERIKPVLATLEPQAKRARTALPQAASGALDGVLPAAAGLMGAVRHQVEAGRDTRATRRELRDSHGRRLRASAYAFGPEGPKRGRRRARSGVPRVAGSLLPAAVKVALVVLIAGFGFLASSSAYINYAADLPDAHTITSAPLDEDTMIYAANGMLLADLHPQDAPQHYYESLDQMGKWLPDATIAVEDAGFWTEPGIDVFAMGRAAWIDWRQKQPVQGASTITQQLVKLRLTGNEPTVDRKIREAVLAIQVEHTYTKRQILEQYLNSVDYANHARGTLAASRVYFHKDTKDLDLAQASMLAGIPQSPLYNDPFAHWDQAKNRQKQVLDAMVRTHKITQEQSDEAYGEDLSPPDHMFRPAQQILVPGAQTFVHWIEDQIAAKYGQQALFGGGLHVQTTINMQLQAEGQKAIVDQVNTYRTRFRESQGAMTAIDPRTGAVLAMVGQADPNGPGGQYDFAYKVPRSPGSSMKIYTYTAAIESGKYTMSTMIPDTPVTVVMGQGEPNYQPKNYDGGYHGTLQLQQAMGNSYNVPAVKVEMSIGIDRVVDMARRMGAPPLVPHFSANGTALPFTSDDPPSTFGPSLTLGGYGETPLQMATGASVLGAQGVYHQPFGIASITASDGTPIFKADPNKGAHQVLDPKVAYIMEQIMSNDQNRTKAFGANSALTLPGRRVGAKTGTAETFSDGWTVGYTPSLASAFWFGNANYSLMTYGADAIQTAAPAWHAFMQSALDTLNAPKDEWFSEPPGLGHANVGGEPVWYLAGTNPNQPMPPLPSNVRTSSAPTDPNKKPGQPNGGNGNNGQN